MERAAGSALALAGLAGLVVVQEFGCKPPASSEPTVELSAVLEQVAPGVVLPALSSFQTDATALETAVAAWVADPAAKAAAQQAWITAMTSWQRVDPVALGPLGSPLTAVGGAYLRDGIYSWPTTNPCLVDQHTVGRQYEASDFLTTSRVNAYGLDALEHLLFAGAQNACPGQVPINSEGTWAALGPDGVDAARAAHAATLAGLVATHAEEAIDAWQAHRLDATVYGSDQGALDGLFAALYQLEIAVADRKLAEPFAQRNCSVECLELVESKGLSALSHVWVAQNLRGLAALYRGGEGQGLDDLLTEVGEVELAASIEAAFDEAIQRAESVDRPLDVLYTEDEAAALELLDAVRHVTDLLEDEMAPRLALTIPAEAGGDND